VLIKNYSKVSPPGEPEVDFCERYLSIYVEEMTPARSSTRAGGAEVEEDKLQNLILDSVIAKVKKDKLQMMGT
jgi:hypothetical protein